MGFVGNSSYIGLTERWYARTLVLYLGQVLMLMDTFYSGERMEDSARNSY